MVGKLAFEKFESIQLLKDVQDKHREWLKDYKGKPFGKAIDGKNISKWKDSEYQDYKWDPGVNLIGRLENRTIIEFDGDEKEAKKFLNEAEEKLKQNGWGYIRSTHNGKSDYLWVEFSSKLKDKDVEKFLKFIAPHGSTIDINFASSKRVFPVLFAVHRKHSYYREMPVTFFKGIQIPYGDDKLEKEEEFDYRTYKKPSHIFKKESQADEFNKNQPIFYDKAGIWWLWNKKSLFWEMTDEVDILNLINEAIGIEIIKSQERTEILNSLKQIGRKNIPKPIKPTWIQFDKEIYDIKTGEVLIPSSDYFVTNPIPYSLHRDKYLETPTMDRIFEEWVGNKYVRTLYEILAYCLLPDYPLNRMFCFIGSGMNGKSKFLELLTKFVGEQNCTSTELDTLLTSRFEVTRLHKKLVCQMGETNFNELSKTSILKKLTGGDLIGFEYKNKNPFLDKNYAKILISTNSLPATTDKTIGFYRRWLIIDFPNQFNEQKDILKEIPEEEYESLALKCCLILKDLLDSRRFTNEGTVEERMERYESKSDYLQKFISDFTLEDTDGYITKSDFNKRFTQWCTSNRHRVLTDMSIGMKVKAKGIEEGKRYFSWMNDGKGGDARVWQGVKWKE